MVTTPVGDRYVTERMRADGLCLGGEQSGHVVLPSTRRTGDGILTALHLLAQVAATGSSLPSSPRSSSGCPRCWSTCPSSTAAVALSRAAAADRAAGRPSSATTGRVLVRASGTEPLVRVMVEAPGAAQAAAIAERLAAAIR